MIVCGIDPGLRSTGIAVVRSQGPGLPELLDRATYRSDPASLDDMAETVLGGLSDLMRWERHSVDLYAIESFAYRPWLPYRVRDSVEMGRMVERIGGFLRGLGCEVVEIGPEVSKAGWPRLERERKRLMPAELRNGHERDAAQVAYAASSRATTEARA